MDDMDLMTAVLGREYTVRDVTADDADMVSFLFSLGCFSGEPITVISRRRSSCTVAIKDARYHIDRRLAQSILV